MTKSLYLGINKNQEKHIKLYHPNIIKEKQLPFHINPFTYFSFSFSFFLLSAHSRCEGGEVGVGGERERQIKNIFVNYK